MVGREAKITFYVIIRLRNQISLEPVLSPSCEDQLCATFFLESVVQIATPTI